MSLTSRARPRPDLSGSAEAPVASPGSRLGWLDLLRGVAALTIAGEHFVQMVVPELYARITHHFDVASFGVFLFFLVSGYIVPASLERRGSVRGFWISRFFRIYPLCLVVVLAGIAVWTVGAYTVLSPVSPFPAKHPAVAALANLTMLHDFVGVGGSLFVMWTLSYEMAFYLLVAGLFVLGLHRRSAEISAGLALIGALAAGLFPVLLFSRDLHSTKVTVAVSAAVMVAGLICLLSRRRALSVTGAVLLTGLALVLVTVNGRMPGWYGLSILATMFAGTAIYRAEQGQISRRKCAVACVVALGAVVAAGACWDEHARLTHHVQWQWVAAMLATWAVFGLGLLLRGRAVPRFLTWLGSVSYSIYLVHAVLLCVLLWLISPTAVRDIPLWSRFGIGIVFIAVVLVVSQLTFTLVEQPAQRLGRRVTAFVERRADGGV
ncbi:acyltransferase family protein [Kitasatospora sp. DSM 101779]|uniref:acyltransferase family protein n=1 Tax=Kitasatospora sp. DSM 101779 TaxID=2853165 RepID=UPI0021DB56D5|nr:acyltransferase [Kitasatospora sp. DSM 101779]MCU7824284.1 acyltransferase [Kitasatospora sp. DSM 101779]